MKILSRRSVLAIAALSIAFLALILWGMPALDAWHWRLTEGAPGVNTARVELADGLRWVDDYYVVADMGNGAYAIGEPRYGQCNFSYLITGSRRSLLFDGGPGVRDIRPLVSSLTRLPVEVLPSHLHFDHVGNLSRFAHIDLPDLPALRAQAHGNEIRLGFFQFLGFVEGFSVPTFSVSRWVPPDGEIDLGDRRLTVVNLPGHTPESVALVDHAGNRVFAGDFIYPSDIYAQYPGANLRDYAASAQRLLTLTNASTAFHGAHGCDALPRVDVPRLTASDLSALAGALGKTASTSSGPVAYPRRIRVNERMTLLAKFPWMMN